MVKFSETVDEGLITFGGLVSGFVATVGAGRIWLVAGYLLIEFLPLWLWDNHLMDMSEKTFKDAWKRRGFLTLRFFTEVALLGIFTFSWYGLCQNWWGLLAALIIVIVRWNLYDFFNR